MCCSWTLRVRSVVYMKKHMTIYFFTAKPLKRVWFASSNDFRVEDRHKMRQMQIKVSSPQRWTPPPSDSAKINLD
ncbi:hypothetical protein M6B38_218310 [Iris pallida]|uniref:Uncharacterized protein n=1 Tax=Iris pallida TaxID=29817 RepID=A0AAX6DXK9_IRIPA|nr:hypothetical protein M6B38_218310 [Iris pallida]